MATANYHNFYLPKGKDHVATLNVFVLLVSLLGTDEAINMQELLRRIAYLFGRSWRRCNRELIDDCMHDTKLPMFEDGSFKLADCGPEPEARYRQLMLSEN